MKMKVIGITGPSGAGKGVCCEILMKNGIACIDTDSVYHGLILADTPCTAELTLAFGKEILATDGSVDRKRLASIVFSDNTRQKNLLLNKITHKYVKEETLRLLDFYQKQGIKATAIDAPLLFEASFEEMCDFCVAILAPQELRLSRIIERDKLDTERAQARLSAQKPDCYYTERAQYTVINDGDKENVQKQVEQILSNEKLRF